MCDRHFKDMNPNMKTESTTTSDKASAVALSDGLEGPFIKAWICVDCGKELTWNEKMQSFGACPYCGHIVPGTIVETHEFSKRQHKKEKATFGERWGYFKAMFMMW